MKKALSLVLAVCMMFSTAVMASAASTNPNARDSDSGNIVDSGIHDDPTFNPGGSTGGGSGGSGGGGGGGGSSSSGSKTSTSADRTFSNIPLGSKLGGSTNIGGSTTTTTGSVTTASATKATTSAVASAVSQAVATGSNKASAKVTFANASALTTDVMNAIAKAAKSASKGLDVSVVVNADTVDKSGAVLARMSVDVALALRNGSAIQTTIDVNPNSTVNANIANHFAKYFTNEIATVAFAQKGSFGMNVPVAVKANLSALDVSSLVFYSYDVASNSFVEIQTEYFVDTNGYLHFTTPVGNNIVITDAPLTAK